MADGLSAATLAIYLTLSLPVLFLLKKHGRHGFLGWLFLFLFCTLRIISGAMALKSTSGAASIVSNVGLSPLLLASAGILHEARILRLPRLDQKNEWVLVLVYHLAVVAGVALTAAGSANLQHPSAEHPVEKSLKMVKAGIAILAVSWGALVAWAGATFTTRGNTNENASAARAGSMLLSSVCFSLVFIGIRIFYSVVALSTQKSYLSPTTGALPIRVLLAFLPELITTLAYIAAGFKTNPKGDVSSRS